MTEEIAPGGTAGPVVAADRPEAADPAVLVHSATGLLRDWNRAGVLDQADVHVAVRLGALGGEADERVLLAVALLVRAARNGSTCLDLAAPIGPGIDLPVPAAAAWIAALAAGPLCGPSRPMYLDESRLYLERYWQEETEVCRDIIERVGRPFPAPDQPRLDASLNRLFGASTAEWSADEAQRTAAQVAASGRLTVLAGGPGTGKTTTVARLLAVLADQPGPALRIAMAAPSGKAAARLTEAVRAEAQRLPDEDRTRLGDRQATTLHRLLGWKANARNRFRHDRDNRLPHDVVVVDEASMLSLTMMARLLEALRPDARLVLVGDPDQLASVDAGAVLADVVGGLTRGSTPGAAVRSGRPPVVRLHSVHRFGGAIADLAAAVRDGDAEAALQVLQRGDLAVQFSDQGLRQDVVAAAVAIRDAAEVGDVAGALDRMQRHRLVCGHRLGPEGVDGWTRRITSWLAEDAGIVPEGQWYVGRPLLITQNDYGTGLFNGDTGVVVRAPDGSPRAAFDSADGPRDVAPSRLGALETVHAMTVHRSQGSQFDRVSVSLPDLDSPLLTRELFYTALTRARRFVRVIGTAEQVVAAVLQPAARATGLRDRLVGGPAG